jgi:hypothetical protein
MSVGNNILEAQPLLSNSTPSSYQGSPPGSSSRIRDEETVILVDEDAETSDSPGEPWTRKQIIVYSILTLLGLFILAIFIKGFIESDDVEVCYVVDRGMFLHAQRSC